MKKAYLFNTYEIVHEEREQAVLANTYEEALVLAAKGEFEPNEGDVELHYDRPADAPAFEEIPNQNPKHYPVLVLWNEHQYLLRSPQDLPDFEKFNREKIPIGLSYYELNNAFEGRPSLFTLINKLDAFIKEQD